MEPETDSNGIWGLIKAATNKKYLSIGNDLVCDPESDNGCDDEKGDIRLENNNDDDKYKKLWRRVGDQFVSKLGSTYIPLKLSSVHQYNYPVLMIQYISYYSQKIFN